MQAVWSNQKANNSRETAYKSKSMALLMINDDEAEKMRSLNDYRLKLIRTHPTSIVMFKRAEGVFQAIRVISVDGCWLKGLYGAVGIDANDCTYLIVWYVVDRETKENWMWSLGLLADDLQICNIYKWCFMSDRQKNLIPVIETVFPHAEHRFCVRYILTNFRKRFKGKALKDALWACARATYDVAFQKCLTIVKDINIGKSVGIKENNLMEVIPIKCLVMMEVCGRQERDDMCLWEMEVDRIYNHLLSPNNGKELWPKSLDPPITPSALVNFRRGRIQLLVRLEEDEQERLQSGMTRKGQVSRRGQVKTCSRCGKIGYNKRKCVYVPLQHDAPNEADVGSGTQPTPPHVDVAGSGTQPAPHEAGSRIQPAPPHEPAASHEPAAPHEARFGLMKMDLDSQAHLLNWILNLMFHWML
ncbi:uncharacterized protein LOC126678443 [Mercurialis annua]|uniref:uncharacterized protein LOC126678443 n=1 Tax=Mercurialis annua TaxID=3986 RepID=UPI00215FBB9A|nr:uncharacterized protein LOC126678443 [Mercurialis annua]